MYGAKRLTYLCGVTSTVQLYLLPIGALPSLNVVSGCAAFGALAYVRQLLRYPWFWLTCALYVEQAVSLAWSPSLRVGIRALVYQVPFIFLSLAMVVITKENRETAVRLMKITLATTTLQSVFVIIFRILPALKLRYLGSPFAYPFNAINRLQDVFERVGVSNLMDPTKSGGLITYANPTAAWLGMAAVVAWYFARTYNSRGLKLVAAVDFTAVFFTGSKSGAVVAVGLVGLVLLMDSVYQLRTTRRVDLRYLIVLCGGLATLAAAIPFAIELPQTARFFGNSSATLQSRQEIWKVAQQAYRVHPIKGLGFGGWEIAVPRTGRGLRGLPPHNAFVLLWAQSGIVAAILGAGFSIAFLWWAWRRGMHGDPEESAVARSLFAGFLCLLILTQGENFGLFGDEHMRPLLALLAGFLAGLRQEPIDGTALDHPPALAVATS